MTILLPSTGVAAGGPAGTPIPGVGGGGPAGTVAGSRSEPSPSAGVTGVAGTLPRNLPQLLPVSAAGAYELLVVLLLLSFGSMSRGQKNLNSQQPIQCF